MLDNYHNNYLKKIHFAVPNLQAKDIIIARVMKTFPLFIPSRLKREEFKSDEEYLTHLGYFKNGQREEPTIIDANVEKLAKVMFPIMLDDALIGRLY